MQFYIMYCNGLTMIYDTPDKLNHVWEIYGPHVPDVSYVDGLSWRIHD